MFELEEHSDGMDIASFQFTKINLLTSLQSDTSSNAFISPESVSPILPPESSRSTIYQRNIVAVASSKARPESQRYKNGNTMKSIFQKGLSFVFYLFFQ